MRKNLWRDVPICLAVTGTVLAVVLWPLHPVGYAAPKATVCFSNLKQSSLGLIQYASDENDRFPLRDHWMDATYPYTKTETIWHCPAVPKDAYGYAFNGALSGAKAPRDEAGTPLVYDSVDPVRNASDLVASLPLPGRHGSGKGGGGGEQRRVRRWAREGGAGAVIARVRWWEVVLALAMLAFFGAFVLFPVSTGGPRSVRNPCLSNVKGSDLALILYAADADDRLPSRDRWMDATARYAKTETVWHCPSVPKGAFGYAFNAALSMRKQTGIADPAAMPLVYDSVDPIRNASDRVASLPNPGRHGGLDAIGYADGHAKMKRFGTLP